MLIEERKYNRKVHMLCEYLMESGGWIIEKPAPISKAPTKQGGTILFVRDEKTKKYIGFCRIVNSPWGEIWITEICIDPDYRRRGIGKVLVNKVLNMANGKVVIAWAVDQGSEFFNSLGFQLSQAPVYFKFTS